MKFKRYCQRCNKLIPKKTEGWKRYKSKIYCSNYCYTRSLRVERISSKCIVCGISFEYRKGQQTGIFCSQECFHKYCKKRHQSKCDFCGIGIETRLHELKRYRYHFCSAKCQLNWQKSKKVRCVCKICNHVFYAPKSHNRVTCSGHCKGVLSCKIQSNKKGLNKLEKAGHEILSEMGIDFKEQVLIENKFLVDVFISSRKIVIQWDGIYWHNLPKRKLLDISQDSYMKSSGYKILRFTDKQVYNNKDYVVNSIRDSIK